MAYNFKPLNREQQWLMPPSIDDWLPQEHLARFIVANGFERISLAVPSRWNRLSRV